MAGSTEMNSGLGKQTESWTALKKWLKRFAETYQKGAPLSSPQTEAYRIALCDLTASQVEDACLKVLRDWRFAVMPPPGFIRECIATDQTKYLGPPQEKYPEVTPEDREGAEEYSQALRKVLNTKEKALRPVTIESKSIDSAQLDEMLRKYREWLTTQCERDKFDESIGLSPLPRYEAERLAIFLALPAETRRRMARSGEWKKLRTNSM